MGLTNPPAYNYDPLTPTSTELATEESVAETPESYEFKLKVLHEDRQKLALRQAFIWAMTATVGGTIIGVVYVAMRF